MGTTLSRTSILDFVGVLLFQYIERLESMNDPLKLLKADHREARDLLHDLKITDPVDMQTELLEALTKLLNRHWKVALEIVYPRMKSANLAAEAAEAEVEHELQNECLEQLNLMRGEPGFAAIVAMLAGGYKHHARQEEKHLLPTLRKMLGDDEWADFGDQLLVAQSVFDAQDRVAARARADKTTPVRVAKTRKALTLVKKKTSVRAQPIRSGAGKKSGRKLVATRK
jgi:hypothetical protein